MSESSTTPDPRKSSDNLLDQIGIAGKRALVYSRRRFLWTWLAISLLAILTCAALWLGIRGAQNDNAQNTVLAANANHTADTAKEGTKDVTLFLRGQQGLPGVPGADGKDGSPGQPGAPGSALANQVAATAAAVSNEKATPGPAGPAGPMGTTGPLGPIGPAGNSGASGQPGAQGAQGDAGPVGDKGNQGDTGDPGEPGDPGAAGPTGPTGATGAQGPPGPAGAAGAEGQQGLPGATGPAGPPGPSGVGTTTVVTTTSVVNPGNTKTVTAACTAGDLILGGGFSIDPQVTQLELQRSSPDGEGWTVTVTEDGLAAAVEWSVTAYAICSS